MILHKLYSMLALLLSSELVPITGVNSFEDLDYILTSRLCDCIDLSLKYRQVRKEIWFEIGLSAFPSARVQFQRTGP